MCIITIRGVRGQPRIDVTRINLDRDRSEIHPAATTQVRAPLEPLLGCDRQVGAGLIALASVAHQVLTPILARIAPRNSVTLTFVVAGAGVLLLLVSHHPGPAIAYAVLAGAAIGILSTMQGIYTSELVAEEHLSLLMGAQTGHVSAGQRRGTGRRRRDLPGDRHLRPRRRADRGRLCPGRCRARDHRPSP